MTDKKLHDSVRLRPSDREYVEWTTAESVDIDTALNHSTCQDCGEQLYWEMKPTPVEPTYDAECCEKHYTIRVETVSIDITDATI